MATLPDIDTSNVSFIAYWNAIDQGGVDPANWSPSEVTDYTLVGSIETYDNGVQGNIEIDGRDSRYRAKQDGWIVCWLDRTEEYGLSVNEDRHGPWEATGFNVNSNSSLSPSALSSNIEGLFTTTSVSGNIDVSFNQSDVSHYNYQNSEATNFTVLSKQMFNYGGGGDSGEWTYSGTKVEHYVFGKADTQTAEGSASVGGLNSPSTTIVDSDGSYTVGAVKASDIDYAQEPGLNYQVYVNSNNYSTALIANLVLWK